MKKFLNTLLIFTLSSAVFYVVMILFFGRFVHPVFKPSINYWKGSYGHLHSRVADINNYKNVDVLFLGSSHAYRGFDTRIFEEAGIRSFNLGSSSQTPTQTKILLDRYLKTLNPKLIIYEVYPNTFTADGVESSLDLIANDKNDLNSLKMAFKVNNVKTYNTLIYGYWNDLLGIDNSYKEPIEKGDDKYIPGGFVERKITYYSPQKYEKTKIAITDYQLKTFNEIVSMIKNNHIDLILVYAPIPKANYHSYINTSYFDSLMQSYGKYYNFNEMVDLNDSLDFYDSHHLNQNGVKIFDHKLIEVLKHNKK